MSKITSSFESEIKSCWAYGKFAVELLERVATDNKLNFETLWSQYFPNLTSVKALKQSRHFIKECDPRNRVAPAKSDYHFFLTAQSKAIQEKGETYEIAKHGKVIGGLWKSLNDSERSVYQGLALADKERRQRELDVIEESIRTGALQDSPFRRNVRHRTGNVSALNMYVKEMTQTLRTSEPTLSNTQRMKQIHQQWAVLGETDRARYQLVATETNRAHAEAAAGSVSAETVVAATAVETTVAAPAPKKAKAVKAPKEATATSAVVAAPVVVEAVATTAAAPVVAKEAAPKKAKAPKEAAATPAVAVPAAPVVAKEATAPKAAATPKAPKVATEPKVAGEPKAAKVKAAKSS